MEGFLRVVKAKLPNFYKDLMCNIQEERKAYSVLISSLGSYL